MSNKTKDTENNENEKVNKKNKKTKISEKSIEENTKEENTKEENICQENKNETDSNQNSLPINGRERESGVEKNKLILNLKEEEKNYIMHAIYDEHTIKSIKAKMQLVLKIDSRIYENYFKDCNSIKEIKNLVEENKFEVTII